ncbi:MAG TPA: vWA domain-containing protein, partial [Gemmataceae bacterium]|nr:vWA domain-containing protein [Gemmataceae bacterium]
MNFELTQPWYLLLALIAAPVLGWYFYRGLADFSKWQRVISLAARAVVVVLLVAALCGLTWLKPSKDLFVVFAVDDSLSVGDEAKPVAEKFLDEAVAAAGRNKFAFVRFAAEPGPVGDDRTSPANLNRMGTNIASAIEVGVAAIPPSYVPRIVLLSDGNQTAGDAIRTALQGKAPISTVPLPVRTEPEVQVSSVNVPAQIREG